MESALVIGQVATDEYYSTEGSLIARMPAGTGFNTANWLDRYGIDVSIAATLGSNFPEVQNFDFSKSRRVEEDCPTVEILLNERGEEDRRFIQGEYALENLDSTGEFDLVYLTSGFAEYSEPFIQAEAALKGFCPGPEPEEIDLENFGRFLEESDHVFMNNNEKEILEGRTGEKMQQISIEKGLENIIITDSECIECYADGEITEYGVDTIENPVDTTGAGDAFSATYLACRAEGRGHEYALDRAKKSSRETVMNVGAIPWAKVDERGAL